jgi:hypothetical protein
MIGADTFSTYSITNDMRDFDKPPVPIQRQVREINEAPAVVTYVGPGTYRVLDDQGRPHKFAIKSLCYCSTIPVFCHHRT